VGRHWLFVLRPLLRYSATRDAFVLRFVGRSAGPVLRVDRRHGRRLRGKETFAGVERRGGVRAA
jgi:hypothetical protein